MSESERRRSPDHHRESGSHLQMFVSKATDNSVCRQQQAHRGSCYTCLSHSALTLAGVADRPPPFLVSTFPTFPTFPILSSSRSTGVYDTQAISSHDGDDRQRTCRGASADHRPAAGVGVYRTAEKVLACIYFIYFSLLHDLLTTPAASCLPPSQS